MRARIQAYRAARHRPPKPPADPRVKVPIPVPAQAPAKGEAQKDPTHTAVLGLLLEETLRAEGDEVHLVDPGHKDPEYDDGTAFLIAKLKRSTP